MKNTEIEIGQQYGWASYEGGRQQRVTVVEKNVKSKDWKGTMKTNQRVKDDAGKVFDVPAREIRNPWAEEALRRQYARESAKRQAALEKARAESLLDLIPAMRHAGLEDEKTSIWGFNGSRFVDLMQEFIPDCLEQEGHDDLKRFALVCPLAQSIEDYVMKGHPFKLSAAMLTTVLR
jgi:hypothetical protein